jgi:hypothetical protein
VGRAVKKSEQHPIVHCEVHSPVVLVVVLLGVLLHLEEALPDLAHFRITARLDI